MVDIECRTVLGEIFSKDTGLDVECSLEKGLVCRSGNKSCVDFEIRVLCRCGKFDLIHFLLSLLNYLLLRL